MNSEQILLVQNSFSQVEPIAETAAELFYTRLFEINPELRPLFKGDIKKQGQMLMASIKLAVNGLDRPESILPAVQSLGQRHATYGVKDEHYSAVGTALLWTLEQGLGEAFTPEVRTAWEAAYTLLAEVMQQGVNQNN